jgi:transcriptional regulator with XRE-family HTH domain
MKITNTLSDEATLVELARRVQRARLDQQITQAALAERSGVSRVTVERFESSGGAQIATLVRILRALGLLERLDTLLPETAVRPIEALATRGVGRKRASHPRRLHKAAEKAWTWGDRR